MPLSDRELNRKADEMVANDLTCYPHNGAPGTNGTANRIGTASATLDAAEWSNAVNGDVLYGVDLFFGVLDPANSHDVTHYSIFRSNAFVSWEEMDTAVTVPAGGTFTINADTIGYNGATA